MTVHPDYSDIWAIKPFKEDDYWFMKIGTLKISFEKIKIYLLLFLLCPNIDDAEDVLALAEATPVAKEHLPEVCIVEVPSIVLVIETGLGYYTYPMLVIETKMNAKVCDWSSQVTCCGFFFLVN